MIRRLQALVGAALLAALTSTPSSAARQTIISFKDDPHARSMPVYQPIYAPCCYPWPKKIERTVKRKAKKTQRKSTAKRNRPSTKLVRATPVPAIVVASLPPQRERKSQSRVLQSPPWTVTAAYVEPDFGFAIHPDPERPEPITTWGDRRDIFRRYSESKDVVVLAHTTLACPNGKPFPPKLAQLPRDAASHFGRTAYINSGYRTPERNRRVGGASNSEHKKCRALDWRVAGISVADLRRWVMARLDRYGIGGLGTYGTHLHTDARKATKLVTWTGGRKKKRPTYYAKRKHQRYAAAG